MKLLGFIEKHGYGVLMFALCLGLVIVRVKLIGES